MSTRRLIVELRDALTGKVVEHFHIVIQHVAPSTPDDLTAVAEAAGVLRDVSTDPGPTQSGSDAEFVGVKPVHPQLRHLLADEHLAAVLDDFAGGTR